MSVKLFIYIMYSYCSICFVWFKQSLITAMHFLLTWKVCGSLCQFCIFGCDILALICFSLGWSGISQFFISLRYLYYPSSVLFVISYPFGICIPLWRSICGFFKVLNVSCLIWLIVCFVIWQISTLYLLNRNRNGILFNEWNKMRKVDPHWNTQEG